MLREFMKLYGPIAFGVVALVVIWEVIVGPELHAQRSVAASQTAAITASVEEIRGAAKMLADVTNTNYQASMALREAAIVMERTVQEIRSLQRP